MKTIAIILAILSAPLIYKVMTDNLGLNEIGSLLAILAAHGVGLHLVLKQ